MFDDFDAATEGAFRDRFGGFLRPEDDSARLDRLLWDGKTDQARRLLPRVRGSERAVATARIALRESDPGVERAIAAVPKEAQGDAGLLFARLRWRAARGNDAGVREILVQPPKSLGRPEQWWNYQQRAIRAAMEERSFKLAYRCYSASCNGHEQSIVDWEISEAWRTWRHRYPTDYLDRIEEKWLSLVDPARLPALYVGNQHQAPQGFLVLGIARDVTPVEPTPVGPGPGDAAPRSSDGTSTDPPRSTEGRLFDL